MKRYTYEASYNAPAGIFEFIGQLGNPDDAWFPRRLAENALCGMLPVDPLAHWAVTVDLGPGERIVIAIDKEA